MLTIDIASIAVGRIMRRGPLVSAISAVAFAVSMSMGASAQILSDEPVQPTAPRAPTTAPPAAPGQAAPAPAPAPAPTPTTLPAQAPSPSASGSAAASATVSPPSVPSAPPTPAAGAATEEEKTSDHDKFVGHFAVGYLGTSQLPIAGSDGSAAVINAPVIGGRYWLRRNMGIDAGIGFALASGSTTQGATSIDKPSQLGFALHGGVPFALAVGKHYVFELIPEATMGFTSATLKGTTDTDLSGFRLDLGARAGAEIHFGFIGIPELALQATIGLYIHRESRTASPKGGGQESSDGSTTIATSVQGDPWALFANNISALYYF